VNAPIEIRPATVEDAAAVAAVHIGSWRAAYRGIVPQEHLDGLDVARRAEAFREFLAAPVGGERVLVATVAGAVVGFVAFGPYRDGAALHPSEGEIRAIYADAAHWGTGAGRLLMAAALRELAAQGRHPVRLWVLRANERARRFYARAGFAADGAVDVFRVKGGGDLAVELDEVRYVLDGRAGGAAGIG
jgi:L-amino acid N-acyltransferase YncA